MPKYLFDETYHIFPEIEYDLLELCSFCLCELILQSLACYVTEELLKSQVIS